MKKRLVALPLILLVALVLSCLLIPGTSALEPIPEAQLVTTPEGGTATTESGTLDAMIQKLNSVMSPGAATTYELTLLTDATQSVAAVLSGNGKETVKVSLDGHTITSLTTSALYTVNGLESFTLYGGFNHEVEHAKIVSAQPTGEVLNVPVDATATVEIGDLMIEYSGLSANGSILDLGAGATTLRNTIINYTGAAKAPSETETLALIKVGAAAFTMSLSDILDTSASGKVAAISADGAMLRLERGEVDADYAMGLAGASHATIIDTEILAGEAVFTASATETDNVVNTGGVKINAPHIISGGIGKEDVTLWYGTGSTYISGVNPTSEVSVGGAYTTIISVTGGYSLKRETSSAAIITTFVDGATPVEAAASLTTAINTVNAVTDTPTAFTIALMNDLEFKSSAQSLPGEAAGALGTASIFFDFNGFTMQRTTKGGHVFSGQGIFRAFMDGADALGNRGMIKSAMSAGGLLYPSKADTDSLMSITDLDFVYSHLGAKYSVEVADAKYGQQPFMQLANGYVYLEGTKMTYTGEDLGEVVEGKSYTSMVVPYIMTQKNLKMVMKNCEFYDTCTQGVQTRVVNGNGTEGVAYVYMDNIKSDTASCVSITTGITAYVANSDVTARGTAYITSGAAMSYISDTKTTSATTEVASGNAYFLVGDGNNRVITATGGISGGKFEAEGYGFFLTADRSAYTVAYNNITLPEIFTSGMVLQAGKKTYIYGGSLAEGTAVRVSIGDIATSTATVVDGKWCATFDNLPYAQGVTVTITEDTVGAADIVLSNVDIGEIWVMSGQSNAVYDVTNMEDFQEYLALADNYDIRAYIVPAASSMLEKTDANAAWHDVDSAYLARLAGYTKTSLNSIGLSAIAYVMATRLCVELPEGVTVAIIDANYNGSTVEAWIDYDIALEYAPSYAELYKTYLDCYVANGNVYPTDTEMADKNVGTYIKPDKIYQRMATACYNAMIKPLEGFSVAGTIWYQGEGNGGSVTESSDGAYAARFRGVRQTFRNTFGADQSLPMFVIQIPSYFSNLSYFKALQYEMVRDDENSYVVSNSVVGPVFSTDDLYTSSVDGDSMVHYARKSPMGISLAASILENYYGMGQLSAPKIVSAIADGHKIKLTLDRDFEIMWGEEIVGFELAGPDGTFKTAYATVDGRTITLTAPGVMVPKAVRYGFGRASFEMEDGKIITAAKDLYSFVTTVTEDTAKKDVYNVTITDKATGEQLYSFSSDDPAVIRCRGTGNIASTTGQTLPVFEIKIG